MSILITGGTGFVGTNVARYFASQGKDVVLYDRSPLPKKNNVCTDVMDRVKVEIGSVSDLTTLMHVIKRHKVEGVIHGAAIHGEMANKYPVEALQVNVVGTASLLEAARLMGLGRILIISSSGVMGAPDDVVTPRKEEDIVLPLSAIYPISKLTMEQLTYAYRNIYKVDALAVRLRAVYGPTDMSQAVGGHAMPIWKLVQDAVDGKPIIKETGRDSAFDLTYAKDCAKGIYQAFYCKNPSYHVYNLSFGANATMGEICDTLQKVYPKLPIKVGPGMWEGTLAKGAQTDMTYRSSLRPPQDITRARKEFGYEPEWPIARAIPDWIRWITEGKY